MEPSYDPTPQDIEILREWIKQNPHIPKDYDDNFLSSFYRACKGSLQKTKTVLESYCGLGMKHPSMYRDIDPYRKHMKEYLEVAHFFPSPKKTCEGATVLISTVVDMNADPYKHHVLEVFRLQLIYLLIAIKEHTFDGGKVILVTDCRGLTLTHMRDMTPSVLSAWMPAIENSLPIRLQGIHAVNVPTVVEWVFSLIKKLAKQKIGDRIHVHSRKEGLVKVLGKEVLPADLGGDLAHSSELAGQWKKTMEANREYLLEEEKKNRALDTVRPIAQNDHHMIGTFKKLTVD